MIDEKKLIEWLKGKKYITVNENSTELTEEFEKDHQWELSRNCFINKAINFIDEQLTVEPIRAEWIARNPHNPDSFKFCSNCKAEVSALRASYYKFCPECGKYMQGE